MGARKSLRHLSRAVFLLVKLTQPVRSHTSGLVSATGGGDSGSFSSGIVSCTGAFPFTALETLASSGLSEIVPFGVSVLGMRVWFGDSDLCGPRDADESRLKGEIGRSEDEPKEAPRFSRSFDLPFPKPLKADPRFEDDFRSGDDARPYGCWLCLRRPKTVPNRFRGFELCFSCAVRN